MTEVESRESAESPHESLRSSFVHRLARLKRHKDLLVLAIGVVVSGVSTVIGVAHVNWPWLFGLGCAITAVAALTTRALEARKPKKRVINLWAALITSVILLVGVFCYHEWWDPSQAGPQNNQVMVNGGDVQVFPQYDQPDGSQTYEYPPLNSDMPVSIVCYVSLPDGFWYRVYGNNGWIPRDAVHAIPGVAFPALPHC
jgi:hypothetical protein